ncbi:MAG: elongation factor P [Candidatus Omnitrophica bacterium]|nr:elongation factor P [Candidatus Omnitrophota bacterium]
MTINEVAKGLALNVDGNICIVADFNHVKPAKGSAFVRIKLRNLQTGLVIERTYRSAETLEDIPLEERRMQYLYNTGEAYHFMDQTTFEEHVIQKESLGDMINFILDNMEVYGFVYNDKVLKVELPNFIVTKITETEPGVKGDSSKSNSKPAKIETGATIQVPLFVDVGDDIKIDTRSGEYVERVKR